VTIQDLGSAGEFVAAIATVVTLIYLAVQLRGSNRLAKASASRAPNSDLNAINAAFGTDPVFRDAMREILNGALRTELEPDQRTVLDFYLISITNIQEQLFREIRAGILEPDALDFGGAGLFLLPYYRTSWMLYRGYLSSSFVPEFEAKYDLDSSIEADW
jgi:hypothetical protein